jgi:hypothetical protein
MFGVFYKVTRQGKIFAGLNDELIEKFNNLEDAREFCSHENMAGYLDELHSGYVVRKL